MGNAMLISWGASARRRLARARRQPLLPFGHSSFNELLEATRRTRLPEIHHSLEAWFVADGPLACIGTPSEGKAVILIHDLLNDPGTPAVVWELIALHELLHLAVPPRELNGRVSDHPPEFFEREAQLNPTRQEAWDWIWERFGTVLRVDKEREGVMVRRDWRAVRRAQTRCIESIRRRREAY
ncbi:MAG TPA: hypothetical protein VNJ02_12550 [Vicinamibacterales bacterium]|nr:hypothetical protein [Vicinamibacterales bacterium]